MPNHYETRVTITGPREAIATFRERHIKLVEPPEEEMFLDFNTVIPMPQCLEGIAASSDVDNAVEALQGKPEEAWAFTAKNWGEDTLRQAMQAIRAIAECGHKNWYSWCSTNWGTKWNSYNFEITASKLERLAFHFDTAWAPPTPVLSKLVEMYPALKFHVKGRDEFEAKYTDLTHELHGENV